MEVFFTLSLALVLSFLIAKLVSIALANGCVSGLKSTNVSHQTVPQELRFTDRLIVRSFEIQRKVECVEAAVEKIDECVGVSASSSDTVEVHLERENEEETFLLPGNLEKSGLKEECDPLLVVREVSNSGILDELKKSDGSDRRLIEEINVDDSVIETTTNRNDEKISVESTNEEADFSQTVEVMDKADNAQRRIFDSEDDDDWEGIERSEIVTVFAAASKFVGSKVIENRLANLGRELQMEFYGLHKAATEGPCHEPQPVPLKIYARAKWNAWQRLGNISPNEAMEQYISLLSNTFPGWMASAGQSTNEPLEAETLKAPMSNIQTSLTQPNSSDESKAELNLGENRAAHAGDLDVKNKVEG